jgi:hypothetical protein
MNRHALAADRFNQAAANSFERRVSDIYTRILIKKLRGKPLPFYSNMNVNVNVNVNV